MQGAYIFPCLWSIIHFFYPLFSINKTTCSLKCLKFEFPWSPKLLGCSLDPPNFLSLFATFDRLFYFILKSLSNRFLHSSPWNPVTLYIITVSTASAIVTTSLFCWRYRDGSYSKQRFEMLTSTSLCIGNRLEGSSMNTFIFTTLRHEEDYASCRHSRSLACREEII